MRVDAIGEVQFYEVKFKMTPEKLTILLLKFTTAARGSKQEKAAPPPTHTVNLLSHILMH